MQATGFISAFQLEPFVRSLRGLLTLAPTMRRSRKLRRLLTLQVPLQVCDSVLCLLELSPFLGLVFRMTSSWRI